MFVVTGGAGFIGSALVWQLNENGIEDILVVDRMGDEAKWKNLAKRQFSTIIHKDELGTWLEREAAHHEIQGVFHMGASSATTVTDVDYLVANNLNYSISLWNFCAERKIPFIYASSAATYGDGKLGFDDDHVLARQLVPLNPYGFSKQTFDKWVLRQEKRPPFWAGLKFFNVYGPQEYHKGKQSSVIHQLLPQIQETKRVKLFKSHREGVADGDQRRDFVYVKDCVKVMEHLYRQRHEARSGLYNIGSGKARSFADLAMATFSAMDLEPAIDYIPMPEALREHYQYLTEGNLQRLRDQGGYQAPMTSLEAGVRDYVQNYLLAEDPYL